MYSEKTKRIAGTPLTSRLAYPGTEEKLYLISKKLKIAIFESKNLCLLTVYNCYNITVYTKCCKCVQNLIYFLFAKPWKYAFSVVVAESYRYTR